MSYTDLNKAREALTEADRQLMYCGSTDSRNNQRIEIAKAWAFIAYVDKVM